MERRILSRYQSPKPRTAYNDCEVELKTPRHQGGSLSLTFARSLLSGFISTIVFWVLFWFLGNEHTGWSTTSAGFFYNIPISFPFFVLCWDMIFSFHHVTILEGLRHNTAYVVVWIVGLFILYLRIEARVIHISGHMTWLVLMPVYSYLRKLPLSFVLFILFITAQAGYFNFVVFPSKKSGVGGICCGFLLSCLLIVLNHWITKKPNREDCRC